MDKIDLVDFCKKLNDIKKEEHKNEFIKNYANYKEQISNKELKEGGFNRFDIGITIDAYQRL